MKATSSAVACWAAKMRSPSFSRSSSSTTITGRPAAMSAIARSMSAKAVFALPVASLRSLTACPQHLLDVLGDHVDLEVHGVAGGLGTQDGQFQRGRDQADAERLVVDRHDGQRHAVDGDRTLL